MIKSSDSPHTALMIAISAIELALRLMPESPERDELNIIHHTLDEILDEL